ncbi:MAG: hypothetical protein IPL39_02665 [Opitutaceae bacterium]|nr:hypothetical protein [Opitutaceae bacterium]
MSAEVSAAEGGEDPAGAPAPRESWPPLLAAASATLYAGNPFRRLGLSTLAGPREVTRRLEQLKMSLELGAPEFDWAFAPNPPPPGEQLRESAQLLKDTLDRLLHEVFWFWPANYPDEGVDSAMEALLAGDSDTAFLQWQSAAAAGQIVAVHNLAIFHHLAALDVERSGGAIEQETMEWWNAAISQWQQVHHSDEFWERLRQRVVLLADARIPPELPSLIRATLPAAWCGIHASLAIARAKKGQWHETAAHVAFARQVHDVPARAERALEGAIAQVVQGIDLLVRDNARRLTGDASVGLTLTANLLAEAAAELELIETVCGRDSDVYREVSTRVVDAALEGIISYQRRTLDSCGVLPWLTHLTTLAATPEVRRRLEDTADILHSNAIGEKLPPADPNEDPAAAELAEFEAAYRLLLEEFVPGADRLDLGERARAEYLANVRRALRELAHAACYQLEHFDLAARALATAAEISGGAERAALLREREQLLVEIVRRKARELAAEHVRAVAEAAAAPELTEPESLAPAIDPDGPDATISPAESDEAPPGGGPPEVEDAPVVSDRAAAVSDAVAAAAMPGKPVQSELPLWQEAAPELAEAEVLAVGAAVAAAAAAEAVALESASPGPGGVGQLRAFGSDQLHYENDGHVLEIDPNRLVADSVVLGPEEITGLRYGVVDLDTPAGVVRAHRIAWCSTDTVVTLDETNLFAGDPDVAAQQYSLVLEVLYGVVVPGLIVRLVEWIQRGETVPLGPAQLRSEGFAFSGRTFHWPSDAVVPYSQLAHALDGGDLVVIRAGEETETERYALNEVWNAAIAGHVIDALASSTPPPEET